MCHEWWFFYCHCENISIFDISFIVSPVIPFIWGIHKLHAWSLLQIGWLIFASANVHNQQCFCERGIKLTLWTFYTGSFIRGYWDILRVFKDMQHSDQIFSASLPHEQNIASWKLWGKIILLPLDVWCIISDCKVDQHLH